MKDMRYKIVADSCCELPEVYRKSECFEIVPLELLVGEHRIVDDETFDQAAFLQEAAASPECPKSSCPSPERFLQAYQTEAEHIYVVTLSANLSGSHNSALLGKSLYEEKCAEQNWPKKKIHVIDSCSASCGETQIALKAMELEEAGLPFEEIVKQLEQFRDEMNTYFVLDNLETLRKNGRLSGVKALVASTLNIKPVMGSTPEGTIVQLSQAIGMKKALQKMADVIVGDLKNAEEKKLLISHCNCRKRAEALRDLLLARKTFREVIIMDTAGISSMYANDGGVIVAL